MHWIDPKYLPETTGILDRFLINPRGEADGLLMADGTEVHFPPHMSDEIVAGLKPGDALKVRGVRPRGVFMISAISIQVGEAAPILDMGPPDEAGRPKGEAPREPKPHQVVEIEGVVKLVLHGPRGESRGALLEDGVILRVPPHAAELLNELLSPGQPVAARGEGLTNALGTVVAVREIGPSRGKLRPIERPKPDPHREGKPPKPDKKPHKQERAA